MPHNVIIDDGIDGTVAQQRYGSLSLFKGRDWRNAAVVSTILFAQIIDPVAGHLTQRGPLLCTEIGL